MAGQIPSGSDTHLRATRWKATKNDMWNPSYMHMIVHTSTLVCRHHTHKTHTHTQAYGIEEKTKILSILGLHYKKELGTLAHVCKFDS